MGNKKIQEFIDVYATDDTAKPCAEKGESTMQKRTKESFIQTTTQNQAESRKDTQAKTKTFWTSFLFFLKAWLEAITCTFITPDLTQPIVLIILILYLKLIQPNVLVLFRGNKWTLLIVNRHSRPENYTKSATLQCCRIL